MGEPTAIVRVTCRANTVEDTARKLAWTVGHPVRLAAAVPGAATRSLLVLTDLAYNGHDDTILERLGMDIIGKVAGVLSWEVIPSDQWGEAGDQLGGGQSDPEEVLVRALGALPVPVSLMRRDSGKCVWKWMEATGEADTFASAVTASLNRAIVSYTALRGEFLDRGDEGAETGDVLETTLTKALLSMPAPVAVLRGANGRYLWQCMEARGEASTFTAAASAVLEHAVSSYLDARREVMGVYPTTYDLDWQLDA